MVTASGKNKPGWQPLCCAQISGLAFTAVVTLLLVPVMYSFFVLDLKIIKWTGLEQQAVTA